MVFRVVTYSLCICFVSSIYSTYLVRNQKQQQKYKQKRLSKIKKIWFIIFNIPKLTENNELFKMPKEIPMGFYMVDRVERIILQQKSTIQPIIIWFQCEWKQTTHILKHAQHNENKELLTNGTHAHDRDNSMLLHEMDIKQSYWFLRKCNAANATNVFTCVWVGAQQYDSVSDSFNSSAEFDLFIHISEDFVKIHKYNEIRCCVFSKCAKFPWNAILSWYLTKIYSLFQYVPFNVASTIYIKIGSFA